MIEVENANKYFGANHVLQNCDMSVQTGEVVTLLGASGCGKTTLLRCIAGFETPSSGRIVLAGNDVTREPPNRRDVGFVFQNYALFPHMTVAENVAYGLKARRMDKAAIDRAVAEILDLVSLTDFANRFPKSLSGGQQQRVALARSLVMRPKVLLMDEAFSALDAKLRGAMQVELRKIVKHVGITAVCVTHDQAEALTISDRIAVMNAGRIQQFATPEQIYDMPVSAFVADFIGAANILPRATAQGFESAKSKLNGSAALVVRPENLTLRSAPTDAGVEGSVVFARLTGPCVEYEVALKDGTLVRALLDRDRDGAFSVGETVRVDVRNPAACIALSAGMEGVA
ncbi:ABC transporter ATP-binding protein [Jannaschia sp. 2305UL9-9]|uniref:ABC transporter ATP-binding protein n=1 Tax=Jannaschia sp. 2305UL9-9 TaxID=3121638 RepID=UPI003527F1FC